ncbi:erythromycin esterase family protein [Frankia sp. CNm7]|uniref:erythromycin esterase family protein n=1 Tax=Frankia nepalensis TaxID=1836974 RepID=UPI001933C150|nr:erythromycin esterase family protein [Frankia nepalensis]MBL7523149.1 erythromycin esterase family protein [Frankia nepalensis]
MPDLDWLRAAVGPARVVGIGVPTHGARELFTLAHRIIGYLADELDFRAVAMDEPDRPGAALDAYARHGDGDPEAIVRELHPHHRTVEMLRLVGWMRDRATRTPNAPLHFVGLLPTAPAPAAGVAENAAVGGPRAKGAGRNDSPEGGSGKGDDDGAGTQGDGDGRGDEVANGRAAWIGFVEQWLAQAVLRWHAQTAAKIIVLSGISHTAVGHRRTVTTGAAPPVTHRNAGSYLREGLGPGGYASLGLTFHHGVVDLGEGPHPIPPPPAGTVESLLGAPPRPIVLDTRAAADTPLERWLARPATVRLVGPAFDPADPSKAAMSGGSLAEWFDAVAHVGRVSPVHPLGS